MLKDFIIWSISYLSLEKPKWERDSSKWARMILYVLHMRFTNLLNRFQKKTEFIIPIILLRQQLLFYFDKDAMEKILFNLLSNAFKYTESGQNISIELLKKNDAILIKLLIPELELAKKIYLKFLIVFIR